MLPAIRKRLTYANVAMTLALVFAMSGGAYAANKFLITSTKQISPKVLKALKGKAGPAGPAGPAGAAGAGTAGAAGPQGPGGPQGPKGETGTKGEQGVKGENGTNGTTGFTETLPKGKTLKGEWSVVGTATAAANAFATSVNFAFPLKTAPTAHFVKAGVTTAPPGCGKGTAEKPEAEEGNLCVFAGGVINVSGELAIENFFTNEPGASKSGFSLLAVSAASGQVEAIGTWAVTAE
jgi:hypothetical protein